MKFLEFVGGGNIVDLRNHLAGFRIDNICGKSSPQDLFFIDQNFVNTGALQAFNHAAIELLAFANDNLSGFGIGNITGGPLKAQDFGNHTLVNFLAVETESLTGVKQAQELLDTVTKGFQQHGSRQFTTAINADVNQILGIKFEVKPRRSEERRVGKEGRSRWSPYH